ncbi:uncharacterized protein PGTG_12496 [Puccinia graminis f. sp. tritici CRL 75-36-700-3]|uniref:Uncharacterized protein n=1 Tax=Puccinia graminis f. sp. tritici (strain CRL 75-36-700-3 / race SCCL) TaxID=418459 RepID=E3KQG5_PUCGT|nr:uncharacterized protein PGTG_12496 [Puccinia graminis f. sp. tritici CRL 75-36-700-3]EFP86540.2 hypothetical protein PGTG_12496 [Puccinia graminis f. sp. tritici CRL 75-36-700-3]
MHYAHFLLKIYDKSASCHTLLAQWLTAHFKSPPYLILERPRSLKLDSCLLQTTSNCTPMHVHMDPLATLISMVVILDVMMAPVLGHYAAVKRVRKGNENLTCFNCPREGYQAAYKGQRTLSVSSHNTGRGCSLLTSQSSETSACPGIVSGKEWTCDVHSGYQTEESDQMALQRQLKGTP